MATTTPPGIGLLDALFLRGYYRRLDRYRRSNSAVPNTIGPTIAGAAQLLIAEDEHLVVDKASRSHLVMTATVLATYRELKSALPRPEALVMVTALFIDTGKGTSKLGARLLPYLIRDPFRMMVNISKTKQLAYYGKTFEYDLAEDTADAYMLRVHRCFYHSYFLRHGAPELGAMFCLKDNNWADALDPQKVGFAFERPSTLARGGNYCSFEFRRNHAGSAVAEAIRN